MTGSFKERGALNKLLTLSLAKSAQRGVITASAGNHAQAVSYHATILGIRSIIYMPINTPQVKVLATQAYGAEVILHGENYDEANLEARRRAARTGLTLVHAFDDDAVIAGQGTLGLELLQQNPDLRSCCRAHRRRRPDRRDRLRGQGDQSQNPRDRRASRARALR